MIISSVEQIGDDLDLSDVDALGLNRRLGQRIFCFYDLYMRHDNDRSDRDGQACR